MTTGAERWSDQRVFGDRAHFHVNAGATEEEVKSKINNQKNQLCQHITHQNYELTGSV
jgi:hypothetical protein